jgi:TRAP-type C4-dicarboxylate transport system permease large subunit
MLSVARATVPMLIVLAIGVALITAFPQMSLWLPQWFAAR